jgi:hypothetical protein
MRNHVPPDDPDIRRLLSSPARVGGKRVAVGEMCIRRYRDRQHRPEPAWLVELRLRQLLETGRYRASAPGWVPSEMPAWDGYVELKEGEELVGLNRDPEQPRAFTAVTWYRRECLDWIVAPETDDAGPGTIRIQLTSHCVSRYSSRVARDSVPDAARAELQNVIRCARVLPEAPAWFDDYTYGGVPAYWLVVNDWLVLPLRPSSRPCPDMYAAVTCMYRDMPSKVIELHDTKAQLHRESVRLHRVELVKHAGAKPFPDSVIVSSASRLANPYVSPRDLRGQSTREGVRSRRVDATGVDIPPFSSPPLGRGRSADASLGAVRGSVDDQY